MDIIRSIKWLFKSKKINCDQDVPYNSWERKSHVLISTDENRRLALDEALKSRAVMIGHQGRGPRILGNDFDLYRELAKRLATRNPDFSESEKQEGDL